MCVCVLACVCVCVCVVCVRVRADAGVGGVGVVWVVRGGWVVGGGLVGGGGGRCELRWCRGASVSRVSGGCGRERGALGEGAQGAWRGPGAPGGGWGTGT